MSELDVIKALASAGATPTLELLTAAKRAADKAIRDHGPEALKTEFLSWFVDHPNVEAVRWRQYTPYFNDGDTCRFRVGDALVRMEDTPEDSAEGDYEDGFVYADELEDLPFADDDIYLAAFGDHVIVTVTRAGFEVEEYDHS